MSTIKIDGLTFAYGGSYDNIFENVSFVMDTDWKLGFTGRNGRGKTTFLKILKGELPFTGSIQKSVVFDYFPFEVRDMKRYTYEIVEELVPEYEHWVLCKELNLLQMEEECLYRAFETLSFGERTKILLAVLFLRDNRFLLIDEPTNHLDGEGRRAISRYLNQKRGFIIVSHDREFLDNCVDHVLSINKTNIEIQRGNFSSLLQNKLYQDTFEQAENEKLKGQIKVLQQAAKRTANWSDQVEASKIGSHAFDRGHIGHKAAKMMKRSKAILNRQQKAIEEKAKLLKNIESQEKLELKTEGETFKNVLSVKALKLDYDEKMVVEKLSFNIEAGERVAIIGANGSGKSSIIKAILGVVNYSGRIDKPNGLIISYVSQDTSHLKGSLDAYIRNSNVEQWLFKSMLKKLDFSTVQFDKALEDFSEGQKKKVLLAQSIASKSHLYIWDEPLNYIDVISRLQIEQMLLTYKPTMLLVEHDKAFVDKIATKKIQL